MSDLATIRGAIVAVLSAVPGVGVVHDRERYGKRADALAQLYVPAGSDEVRGWFVRRVCTRRTSPAIGSVTVTHEWRITGYASFLDEDDSEIAFDGLIEAMAAAVAADESLGLADVQTVIEEAAGLQVADSGPVTFCGRLCHSARLHLFTRTWE